MICWIIARNASACRQLSPRGVEWSWPKDPVTVMSSRRDPITWMTRPPIVSVTEVMTSKFHSIASGSIRNTMAGPPANPSVALPTLLPGAGLQYLGLLIFLGVNDLPRGDPHDPRHRPAHGAQLRRPRDLLHPALVRPGRAADPRPAVHRPGRE